MKGDILDTWNVLLLGIIVFFILFTLMYQIKPISHSIAEGFMESMQSNRKNISK